MIFRPATLLAFAASSNCPFSRAWDGADGSGGFDGPLSHPDRNAAMRDAAHRELTIRGFFGIPSCVICGPPFDAGVAKTIPWSEARRMLAAAGRASNA